MWSMNEPPVLQLVYLALTAYHYQYPSKPIQWEKSCHTNTIIVLLSYFFLLVTLLWTSCSLNGYHIQSILTSTYETGKIPLRLAILPSNQLSSTRRVSTTNSPLCNDSSIADWAWKLNLARARPSVGFLFGHRTPSFEMIWFRKPNQND